MKKQNKIANKIKIEITGFGLNIEFKKDDKIFCFKYLYSPTGNCQIGFLSDGELLLELSLDDILDIISEVDSLDYMKKILMLDIPYEYKNRIGKLLKPISKEIIKFVYLNTNNKKMSIMMCKLG